MEYQLRREPDRGLFHIVFVNPSQPDVLVRVPGIDIDEQIKKCKPGVKKVPRDLLLFVDKINKYYQRNKNTIPQVPWDIINLEIYPPLSFQKIAIQLLYQSNRKINSLEMGLGKTYTIITLLRIMKAQSKLIDKTKPIHLFSLIVLPPKLKKQWKDEIRKFAPELTVRSINDAKTACFDSNVDIILLSDGLLSNIEMITKIMTTCPKFSLIGVDEAHSMKNYKSERSKAMYRLSCHTTKLILLTGTPCMDHKTTYGLLTLMHPIFHSSRFFHFKPYPLPATDESFWFAIRYCGPFRRPIGRGKFTWEFNIDHRKAELHAILSEFIIHMTKQDCLKDLPPITEKVILLKPINNTYKNEFLLGTEEIKKQREKNGNYANKLLMDLVRKTAELKIPLVVDYLKLILESHEKKIAVFLHHRLLSEGIINGFDKLLIKYLNINADIPIPKRSPMIDDFKNSKDQRVLIVSYGCCAVGLNNLTFIDECYCVERIYEPVLVKQSKARFHRIGQVNPVTIIFLDLPDSTDTMLEQNFNRKNRSNDFLLKNDKIEEKVEEKVHEVKPIKKRQISILKLANYQEFKKIKVEDIDEENDEDPRFIKIW